MEHPVEGGGMDYLGGYSNVQELPKGKAVTLKYRVALDASMTAGNGGVSATAVTPDPLVQLGRADLPFTVLNELAAHCDQVVTELEDGIAGPAAHSELRLEADALEVGLSFGEPDGVPFALQDFGAGGIGRVVVHE
jgi:hypothetical protein